MPYLLLFLFLLPGVLADDDINPDIYLDVPGLITKYGFPVETHIVQTEDGYLLTLHRIPHGRQGDTEDHNRVMARQPILMQHGLLSSSSSWIMGAPEKAPAYIMADAGYDIWLGNARGNTYSRNHTKLDPDGRDGKFWDFSWDEMGYFDVPAMIDYILNKTGHTTLFYIGHSMGTTMFFAGMSARPEYNSKVKAMFALGPVATVSHILSPIRLLAPLTREIEVCAALLKCVTVFTTHTTVSHHLPLSFTTLSKIHLSKITQHAEEDEGRFGAILVSYRQIEEILSELSAGRLQMRHEKSRAPTYRPAVELSGAQFKIASGAQFENAVGPNHV